MQIMERSNEYIFVSGPRMLEIFEKLSKAGQTVKAKMVDRLLQFMGEYNVARPFKQTHDIDFAGGKYIFSKKKRKHPKLFWPKQTGSISRFPWQPRLKGLKIRDDHWLTDPRMLEKIISQN